MRCPNCDANISDTAARCGFCGQDLSVVHYVRRISNTYYNQGLQKAEVRDLSGAIAILKKSLQFNKANTDARNLLGLIYYEMGEIVLALSEWVLSKYLQPDNNRADYFIQTVQANQTELDGANYAIKKYNAALSSALAGSEDLAMIQLKKVVQMSPHLVRAQQLLALLYIHAEQYQNAAKCLNRVRRIDFNNTTTLRYMNEIGSKAGTGNRRDGASPKKAARKKDPLQNVTPVGTYKEEKNSLMPVVYVILGIIVGIVVCFVLIRPTLLRSHVGGADGDGQLAARDTQISSLEEEKKSLKSEIKDLEKKIADGDTDAQKKVSDYEKLLKAADTYIGGDKIQAAIDLGDCTKDDFASDEAKGLYTRIGSLTASQIKELVSQGRNEMYTSYDTAIATFEKVLAVDDDNQEAMYCMGRCYQRLGKNKKAKKLYEAAIAIDSSTSFASQAKQYLEEVKAALGGDGQATEPPENTDEPGSTDQPGTEEDLQ